MGKFKQIGERFRSSAKELYNVRSLVMIALLLGLRIALGYVTTLRITDNIKIGYAIFPNTALGMLFGPVVGGIAGGIADFLGFILRPSGAFFPGYTLDSIVAGMIYGYSFYKREKITPLRVFCTLLCVTVVVNLCMTTTWISIQATVKSFSAFFENPSGAFQDYFTKFMVLLPPRALKNFIMLPINSVGVYFVLQAVRRVAKYFQPNTNRR